MKFDESRSMFNKASSLMRSGDIIQAFDMYCDVLLSRLDGSIPSLDFYLFYRCQLCKYMKEKKSLMLSLAEGDMISDLIFQSYNDFEQSLKDNPFVRTAIGRIRLLMSVKIIFPVQNDTLFDDFPLLVSK